MKNLFIIFLLLFGFKTFSQDLEKLKLHDTIYLVLPETDSLISLKLKNFTLYVNNFKFGIEYQFIDSIGRGSILMQTQNDDSFPNSPKNTIVKRRRFFKEHKDAIVTLDFIKQVGVKEFFVDALQAVHLVHKFYIISESDLKNRKIELKKTLVYASGYAKF
jgi:hypothetical protein